MSSNIQTTVTDGRILTTGPELSSHPISPAQEYLENLRYIDERIRLLEAAAQIEKMR
jgi:hypothetical protein